MVVNGSRLGFYEGLRKNFNQALGVDPQVQLTATSMGAGAMSGVIGAFLGNPLFLIKARMQAYSPALPVGAQRQYRSSFHALSTIFKAERFRGLIRGVDAAMLRTAMGSSVQLPSYIFTKTKLVEYGIMKPDSTWTFLASSSVSGACVLLMMQPADTALTRVYNQPTHKLPNGKVVGTLYKNFVDCLWKTLKTEGFFGWYKGTTAHFLRIVPHTIVTLTANELIVDLYRGFRDRSELAGVTST